MDQAVSVWCGLLKGTTKTRVARPETAFANLEEGRNGSLCHRYHAE
jgi:hypothetical protein